jgi:hypothetical protein
MKYSANGDDSIMDDPNPLDQTVTEEINNEEKLQQSLIAGDARNIIST